MTRQLAKIIADSGVQHRKQIRGEADILGYKKL